jgi:hypothetical protein
MVETITFELIPPTAPVPVVDSFETGADVGFDWTPDGWIMYGAGGSFQSTSNVVDGTYSVQLTGSGKGMDKVFDLTGSTEMKINLVRVNNVNVTIKVGGNRGANDGTEVYNETNFTNGEQTIDISSFSGMQIIYISYTNIGGGQCYIDFLRLNL